MGNHRSTPALYHRKVGRPFSDNHTIMEAIVYRFRIGCPWRDLVERFGPRQTLWKRHNLYSRTGVYDAIHQPVVALKDTEGTIDWSLSEAVEEVSPELLVMA